MTKFEQCKEELLNSPKKWLVTGVAGFIGSNLLEELLNLNQIVIGLDNFSTGHERNLLEVKESVGDEKWENFSFHRGDIRDFDTCVTLTSGVDYVLHQGALGSVPRSIDNPILSNNVNIDGFLNMLTASKNNEVKSFVYAASSSTYGDHKALPKVEDVIGSPLSPYAVTKYVNELYSDVFYKNYGFASIGLRYFNVFGKRQDPDGAYAAVIPKWTASMIKGKNIIINGEGDTSRDFCYIKNVVEMNILAATSGLEKSEVFNVAIGEQTSLNQLFSDIKDNLEVLGFTGVEDPTHKDYRAGDVKHSLADVSKAKMMLGYQGKYTIKDGLSETMSWYAENIVK